MTGEVKRFQKVLHVREVERSITQSELAERLQEESDILSAISTMEKKRDKALSDFCSSRGELVSPQQLWFERQSIDVIDRSLDTGRRELDSCRRRIEETKDVLVEKHRNVQLMERHVDKLIKRDQKIMQAAEQNALDDVTSIRYLINRRGGMSA